MTSDSLQTPAVFAVLTLAEVKCATDAFDRGESNIVDALEAISAAIAAYQAAARPGSRRDAA